MYFARYFDLPHPLPWDRTASNNSPPRCRKRWSCFGGCPGEMVTGQIEKCISGLVVFVCLILQFTWFVAWADQLLVQFILSFNGFWETRWGRPRRGELAPLFSTIVVLNAPFNSRFVDLFNTLNWIPFYRESNRDAYLNYGNQLILHPFIRMVIESQ